jgi:tRNA-dihydrouridine synthase
VINKVRALCTWYSKGVDNGSHLRIAINRAESVDQVRDVVARFFVPPAGARRTCLEPLDVAAGMGR